MRYLTMILAVLVLAGCSEDEFGRIRLAVVDSPAEYDAVNIAITAVQVHQANSDSSGGWIDIASTPGTYDLLTLRNGLSAIIADDALPPGHYTEIRLIIGTGSSVELSGTTYPLEVPSGIQSGLKLNHQFSIDANVTYDLTLDFDAERSVVVTGNGQYQLSPVIRLQANEAAGTISGTALPVEAWLSVWTMVESDTVSAVPDASTGYFKLMALPSGSYTLTVVAANTAYQNKTLETVTVVEGQNTDIGSIVLSGPQ